MPDQSPQIDALLAEVAALRAATGVAADLQAIKTQLADLSAKVDRALTGQVDNPEDEGVAAWSVRDWCKATSIGTTKAYDLINDGAIDSVKHGHSRLILTPPKDYLLRLKLRVAGNR